MKLKTISRRSFLKGAGVAALAVAAAGMMTGCSSSSSSKKDPVTPTPTPTTKKATVEFYDSDSEQLVCTNEINVDVTKIDATNPMILSTYLSLPDDYAEDYTVDAGSYPISIEDGKYVIRAYVSKSAATVQVKFYLNNKDTDPDMIVGMYPDEHLDEITRAVPVGATEVSASELNLPSLPFKVEDKVTIENGVAYVKISYIL